MLAASLLEGLAHLALLCAADTGVAVLLLILGGIPEMLSYAAYFTCVQERLPPDKQATFYSMQQPLFDIALTLGIASASSAYREPLEPRNLLGVAVTVLHRASAAPDHTAPSDPPAGPISAYEAERR